MTIGIVIGLVWLVSSVTVTGWYFAHVQSRFPNLAERGAREDLGHAIMFGILYGVLGPIGVLAAWLMTGFAQYGWRLTYKPIGR